MLKDAAIYEKDAEELSLRSGQQNKEYAVHL